MVHSDVVGEGGNTTSYRCVGYVLFGRSAGEVSSRPFGDFRFLIASAMADWTTHATRGLTFASAVLIVLAVYTFVFRPDVPGVTGRSPASAGTGSVPMADVDTSGQRAPDFTLPTMDGDSLRLSAHRGEVIVLNFWATWCAPCRKEIPMFVEMQRELGGDGLQFIGVSLDEEGFEVVRPFAEDMSVNYPMVVDDGTVAPMYGGIPTVPTTFLIGPEGRVHGYAPGLVTESVLRPRVENLLAMIDD
jgi:cytochrome c biogenesis protein CcmG/thiol:disulfide interchange protein DsbE